MPIYEYRRPDGTTFEVQQPFSDEPLTVDPETGVRVERVLHPPAVHFKGKGFYNTDYGTRRRQRETAAAEGAKGEASSNGAAPEKPSGAEKDTAKEKSGAQKADASGPVKAKS
jgi:putative FmdB family regulatory protein